MAMMTSWKEKFGDRLTRLLADSPSSSTTHPSGRDSPVIRDDVPKIVPFPSGLHSPEPCSVSSQLASFLQKTSSVLDKVKTDIPKSWSGVRPIPFGSLPTKWKSKRFSSKERTMHSSVDINDGSSSVDFTDGSQSKEAVEISKENQEYASKRNIDYDILVEEALISDSSEDFLPNLMDESVFLSSNLFEFLQSSLPNIVKGCQWVLLYRTVL